MNNFEYGQIIAAYILSKLQKNVTHDMVLKRMGKSGIVTKIDPSVRSRECSIDAYLNHEKYNNTIVKFYQILTTKLSHCKNTAFYKNIKSLGFKEIEFPAWADYEAIYDADYNSVFVNTDITERNNELENEELMYHELLHMASSYKKGTVVLMGFMQSLSKGHSIGNGLNEGFTEYLAAKYFYQKKMPKSYLEQAFIAEGLENIVGAERMEQLYFSADLKGLIGDLSNFCTEEEAISLIKKIDTCHEYCGTHELLYSRAAAEVRVKIAKLYAKQQKQLLDSGQITKEEYEDNIIKNGIFYVKGYKLEKTNKGYGYRHRDSETGRVLTDEAYDEIKKEFFGKQETDEIIFDEYDFIIQPSDIIEFTQERWEKSIYGKPPLNFRYTINDVIEEKKGKRVSQELEGMFTSEDSTSSSNSNKKNGTK